MEQLSQQNGNEKLLTPEQIQEKENKAIEQELSRLFSGLEKEDVSPQDLLKLLGKIWENNIPMQNEFRFYQISVLQDFQNQFKNTPKEKPQTDVENASFLKKTDLLLEHEKYGFLLFHLTSTELKSGTIEYFHPKFSQALSRYDKNPQILETLLWGKQKVKHALEFLQTDFWKEMLDNTNLFQKMSWVGSVLQIASFEINKEGKDLTLDILVSAQKSLDVIAKETQDIQSRLTHITSPDNRRQMTLNGNYGNYERIVWVDLPNELHAKVQTELKILWKDIFTQILLSGNTDVIEKRGNVLLPLWWEQVRLDFSKLPESFDLKSMTLEEKLQAIETYFDDVYIDSFSEIFLQKAKEVIDYAQKHPEKLFVDVASILVSWFVAMWIVAGWTYTTWWLWFVASSVVAGTAFTATDNTIRALWYGIIWELWLDSVDGKIGFKAWALEWMWLTQEHLDNPNLALTKKWFELASNTILYWMFSGAWRVQAILSKASISWTGSLWNNIAKNITSFFPEWKISQEWLKLIWESAFFWYYAIHANAYEDYLLATQDSRNMNEEEATELLMENLAKRKDPEVLMHYFLYNLWFISLVKTGWAGWQKYAENKINNLPERLIDKKIQSLSDSMNTEILTLQNRGITLVREWNGNLAFYDKNLNKVPLDNAEFMRFNQLQLELIHVSLKAQRIYKDYDDISAWLPNNGKGWWVKVNKSDLQVKYETLERISKEAEKQWLNFVLEKNTIYDWVSKIWIKEWTKDGLLKEAWFNRSEIDAIKKQETIQGSKKLEDRAVEKMNVAVDIVVRDYQTYLNRYLSWLLEWKNTKEIFPNFSTENLIKLEQLFKKEWLF